MKRFSEWYYIDPSTRTFGGAQYAPLYPESVLKPLFQELGIPEDEYEKSRQIVLGAAFIYENHKETVLERQLSPAKELALIKAFSKHANALADLYVKLDQVGAERMIALAQDLDETIPHRIVLPSVEAIALMAKLAKVAASVTDPLKKAPMIHLPPSHPRYVWVMNIARIFHDDRLPLSVNSIYLTGDSKSLDVLHSFMQPLDPAVKRDQLADAVKLYLKESGKGRLRKKMDRKT